MLRKLFLLRTGQTPLATVMRRLLTGYAVSFNRLIRSAGGWAAVTAMRRAKDHMKSDERILGDGEFAQTVLDEAKERFEERYRLRAQGYDLGKVTDRVSSELGIDPEQVWSYGKHPLTVKARSLLCYWAVRKLGYSATELSKRLGVSQPSVSISVKRGEKIADAEKLQLERE